MSRVLRTRSLSLTLVVMVLAGLGVGLAQGPAHACSCAPLGIEQSAKAASAVFAATVTGAERTDEASGRKRPTIPLWVHTVQVDTVWKGRVDEAEVEIDTGSLGPACGFGELPEGRRYVWFVEGGPDTWRTGLCSGTARASGELVGKVERLLGEGDPMAAPTEPEPTTFEQVADEDPPTLGRTVAPGLALVLLGLLGLVLVRRANR